MALPANDTTPLSLSGIQTEFGGANPIGLSEYYAGGAYVPTGTTGTYGAVPTTGAISIRNFYGTSQFAVLGGSTFVSGTNSRSGAGNVTTTTSSATGGTVVGGSTPYTYLWEYVSGDVATANTATSVSTTFTRTVAVGTGQTIVKSGVYRLKITDNQTNVIYGPNCTVQTTHWSIIWRS